MMVHRSGPPYRGRSGVGWLVVRTMVAEWPRYRFFVHTSKVVGQRWRYPSTRRPLLSLRSNAVESRRAEYLVRVKMSTAWPHSEILNFLEFYRAETIIWNPKHKNHKDKNKVSDAWNRISNNMGIPVDDLKRRRNVNDSFPNKSKKKKVYEVWGWIR
ncbi:hypothetical protein EVAR_65031_1 [Eumeta japonica]|uniref:MADF domain-containing protein n=1 Tax=Eumeta variegata TaxID=151549 RepID=A0A4C1YUH0_EUMVA|nr:hypothetical protein EVAR_65031_1 [Eumeta japonica]